MDNRLIALGVVVFAVLVISGTSQALIGTIQPPRMVLRGNTTDTFTGFVIVSNDNNITMNVSTDLYVDMFRNITLNTSELVLLPNESETIGFEAMVYSPGTNIGEIIFLFSAQNEETQGAALSTQIIIIAEGDEIPVADNSTGNNTIVNNTGNNDVVIGDNDNVSGNLLLEGMIIPAVIVLVLVIGGLVIRSKRGPAWKAKS